MASSSISSSKYVVEPRIDHELKYKGVLGSYHTAEKAARAFDAALFCLRGRHVKFNFPDDPPPEIPGGQTLGSAEIQAVAQQYANSYGHGSSYDQPEGGDAEFRARAMGSDWAGPLHLIDDWSFLDMLDVNGGGGNKNKSGCVLDYGLFPEPSDMYIPPDFAVRDNDILAMKMSYLFFGISDY
ncbi:hypothetical protein DH2020_049389 [Rehmannia glutinosa]|uniref:AP2/ERF domain-containing protein n=1 Tax=Rehmannia glutinosa TaxID=99300 RepID=A0ABR0U2Z4_REHGL